MRMEDVVPSLQVDAWIEVPPPSRRRPTWREYRQGRRAAEAAAAVVGSKGKHKVDDAPGTHSGHQRKRYRQTMLSFASQNQDISSHSTGSSSREPHRSRHSQSPLTGPSDLSRPFVEEGLATVVLPSRKDRSKQVLAQVNPLRPHYKHLSDWEYPDNAQDSLYYESQMWRPSLYFGDQTWQNTHRVTPKAEGHICPWTNKPKTFHTAREYCGRAFISVELMLKHIERCHMVVPVDGFFTCKWGDCVNRKFANSALLRQHIIERHAPQLGWSCAFQTCRLSTSTPSDAVSSNSHITKAHDEIYEPLRPLALPRPASLPVPLLHESFKAVQPPWALLLPCPQASSRAHSRPLPSQLHQNPQAAAGMLGAVPPLLDPGCHPWNIMRPILNDLEPHATPLPQLETATQDCYVEVEGIAMEDGELEAARFAYHTGLTASLRIPSERSSPSIRSLSVSTDEIDINQEEVELMSGFETPDLQLKEDPQEGMAEVRRILLGVADTLRKEVVVQTEHHSPTGDEEGWSSRSRRPVDEGSPPGINTGRIVARAVGSTSAPAGIGTSSAAPASVQTSPALLLSQREQLRSTESSSKEAGVQVGHSMTEGCDVEPNNPQQQEQHQWTNLQARSTPAMGLTLASGTATSSLESKTIHCADAQVQTPTTTAGHMLPVDLARPTRGSTPPPPYTN